jgi:hypothetical protein
VPPFDAWLSPTAQGALIGGTFLALGWIVNGWQNRRRDRALRDERVRDVQRALFAEIRAYLAALKRDDIAIYGDEVARRIETEEGFFPVIPTERNDTVFRAIVSDIHILPRASVDPVVLYYSQISVIHAMIDDLRALDLERIGPQRGAAMYRDYIALKLQAIVLGEDALLLMGAHLDGGPERVAAIEAVRGVTADLSGQQKPDPD